MHVVFLASGEPSSSSSSSSPNDDTLTPQAVSANAHRAFDVLIPSQRPLITTYADIEEFVTKHDKTHQIRWGFAMDFAERLPWLLHPEVVYRLNSKRWLAECGELRSANDRVVDCEIRPCENATSKSNSTSKGGRKELWSYCGGDDCSDCTKAVEEETERVLKILREAEIPYVLKLTQSLSSVGTNIVTSEPEREALVEKIREYLSEYLPRVTEENKHLYTTSLILSECIGGETAALNFYVRRDGNVVFLGACHQLSTGEGGRQATAITYADQKELEKKYAAVLGRIGKVLCKEGYWGAVGADVMETEKGEQVVIDLNVRTPLSLVLYLLREHFERMRGFGIAIVYECVMLKVGRGELQRRFAKEFGQGRIVLLGSTRLGKEEKWAYGMVLAGKWREEVEELSERILRLEADDGGEGEAGGA